jgi:hypothetical protein
MLQNGRRYLETRFFTSEKYALRYGASPNFKKFLILSENLCVGFGTKKTLLLDKPFIIGL